MKKLCIYIAVGVVSLSALVLIGFAVVSFMSARLDISNDRLDAREEERSAVEDRWIASHKRKPNDPLEEINDNELVIEEVAVIGTRGTLEWSDIRGNEGTVIFYVDKDESHSILKKRSDLPETVHGYQRDLEKAIEEAKE
ncbi:hypothetical protein AB4027_06130 [Alkalibacterium putridalgicola]|uniref:hypothetical protein n=1 Tax=Alkalibacterium putridalgicola TaxID=426703 RepID=UPI0034CFC0C7